MLKINNNILYYSSIEKGSNRKEKLHYIIAMNKNNYIEEIFSKYSNKYERFVYDIKNDEMVAWENISPPQYYINERYFKNYDDFTIVNNPDALPLKKKCFYKEGVTVLWYQLTRNYNNEYRIFFGLLYDKLTKIKPI